jgi:hypothetical protein
MANPGNPHDTSNCGETLLETVKKAVGEDSIAYQGFVKAVADCQNREIPPKPTPTPGDGASLFSQDGPFDPNNPIAPWADENTMAIASLMRDAAGKFSPEGPSDPHNPIAPWASELMTHVLAIKEKNIELEARLAEYQALEKGIARVLVSKVL